MFLGLAIGYVGVNLLQSFLSKDAMTVYPSVDWHRRPEVAAVVVVVFLFLEYVVFVLLVRLTNRKLKRRFRLDLPVEVAEEIEAVPAQPMTALPILDQEISVTQHSEISMGDQPMKPMHSDLSPVKSKPPKASAKK